MKSLQLVVSIDEIPDPGWVITGDLPAQWLKDSLLGPYQASEALHVDLLLKRMGDNISLEGTLSTTLTFRCSRTTDMGTFALDVQIHELFQPKDHDELNLGDGVDFDFLGDEPYLYEGHKLDIEPMLREEIVLAQPPYPAISGDPKVKRVVHSTRSPLWSSDAGEVDPRWAKLKNLKIN